MEDGIDWEAVKLLKITPSGKNSGKEISGGSYVTIKPKNLKFTMHYTAVIGGNVYDQLFNKPEKIDDYKTLFSDPEELKFEIKDTINFRLNYKNNMSLL